MQLSRLPTECDALHRETLQGRSGSLDYDEAILMLALVAIGNREFSAAEFSRIMMREGSMKSEIEWSAGGLLEVRSGHIVFSHGIVSLFVGSL